MPAALGLAFMATPILYTIFQYGAFKPFDVAMTTPVLQVYGIGVFAFIALKIVTSAFYARQDIRTPVKIAAYSVVVNILVCLLLFKPLQHVGLAIGTVVAAILNLIALIIILKIRGIFHFYKGWTKFLLRIIIANIFMLSWLYWLTPAVTWWMQNSLWLRLLYLSTLLASAVVVYFGGLYLLGMRIKDMRPPIERISELPVS